MRNLRNLYYEEWKPSAGRLITSSTWDLANDSVLCTFGPTEDSPLIELVRLKAPSNSREHAVITSWDAPCPNPDLSCDEILSLHYFGDSLTACLVLAGGDIVVVREEPLPGEDRIEIVGSIDEGITAARWSPDEELLAITTKANTVVFMSRSFEGVTDTTMTAEDLKASNHVSVGWGKKETQFQGRGAKALRDPTMPEKLDEGVLSPNDDLSVTISWRGDGAYLAVSTIERGARRLIRVYSREGVLDSVSEPVDGLEGALSWRPAGNLIAGVQRFQDRVDVVFFERNGLRHGQFTLRLTPEQLSTPNEHIRLSWNSDSTILAISMAGCTQLWTMGNYHWYLKQEIQTSSLLPTSSVVWHAEKPLKLIAPASESIISMEYVFSIARGSTAPPHDQGTVAVIDGHIVKVTPFRTSNFPPPMALLEIDIGANVIDVAFNADASLIVALYEKGLSIYEWKVLAPSNATSSLTARVTFAKTAQSDGIPLQISFSKTEDVLVLWKSGSRSSVRKYGYDDDTARMMDMTSTATPASVSILSSYSHDGTTRAFAEDVVGDLHSLSPEDVSISHCKLPICLPWVEIVPFGKDCIAFGMSSNGHLYANTRLLVKNCTSFLITPAHLIFTTTTHLLKFVHVTNVSELEVPPDDPEVDERCRSIERGARLITAMPTSLSLVLQMPRGNLETIYPRAMVVAGIRKLIEEKNYKKAFTHCRTQRVDMNILYDHAPEQFLANVELFVNQVKKITYIDLFLSSLREEDVTQTMYKETRGQQPTINSLIPQFNTNDTPVILTKSSSKVNTICDAFLTILSTRKSTNFQNLVTAHVCKSPPALEDGLSLVAELMQSDSTMADKAVEHICFLADVNKLYENALGLYDLDLALLVAQQSQKDPREYLPFMQNLQGMTELRRRFSTDDFLSRNVKALGHLHEMGDAFDEVQTYTKKHALYQAALGLYRYKPEQHATLTLLYSQYLESKSSFREAALAYESLSSYAKATSCYLSTGPSMWRETLSCALSQTPPLSGLALMDLATSLYDGLVEAKDYLSAGTIQLEYLDSIHNAVRSYCKGYHFSQAFHLVAQKHLPLLLSEIVDPALGDALASSTELLSECKAQLLAQVPRIRELRIKALLDPLAFYEGERGPGGEDLPDDVSVAASSRVSTSRSMFTRYTGKGSQGQSIGTAGTGVSRATSKNRRREERKRARGKKGSVYEEEYLVASVGRLIDRVESVRDEIERLIAALVRRGMWERARVIEAALADVLAMCRDCIPEVFEAAETAQAAQVTNLEGEEYRPVGGDAVLAESLEAVGKKKEPPVIKAFERLVLLGS